MNFRKLNDNLLADFATNVVALPGMIEVFRIQGLTDQIKSISRADLSINNLKIDPLA